MKRSEWVFSKSDDYWAGYFGLQLQVQEYKILVLGTNKVFGPGPLWTKKYWSFSTFHAPPSQKNKLFWLLQEKKTNYTSLLPPSKSQTPHRNDFFLTNPCLTSESKSKCPMSALLQIPSFCAWPQSVTLSFPSFSSYKQPLAALRNHADSKINFIWILDIWSLLTYFWRKSAWPFTLL